MPLKKKRPLIVAVALKEQERQELKEAADRAGMALSVLIRAIALTAVRRGELVIDAAAKAA